MVYNINRKVGKIMNKVYVVYVECSYNQYAISTIYKKEENAKTYVYNCIENKGVDAYYEEWEVKDYE